ncbi:hypothetical protein [Umboniibacter marinipuniceus]|uniref:Tetratricopeptide repeat protein n=1 Tax=Umboniibacter marinipuniceus TaxID=569599 RepID=A0A3M0AMF3_9GAMM|nr:hypothetical protein [Umboniibacter marinipuniceus]RMA80152.1 hypothetical protein DFR27_1515 [Umboniibacter marinipuniceus]
MLRRRTWLGLSLLSLTACVGVVQQSKQASFDEAWRTGDSVQSLALAQEYAELNSQQRASNLLWALQLGAVERRAGNHRAAIAAFDDAERRMHFEVNESAVAKAGESVGGLLLNDAALDYEAKYADGVMANTYKAWSFWQLEDVANARVEFNRAEERQRLAVRYFSSQIEAQQSLVSQADDPASIDLAYDASLKQLQRQQAQLFEPTWRAYDGYVNPFTTYSAGLFRLLYATSANDYELAADSFRRVYSLTGSESAQRDFNMARALAAGDSSFRPDGDVWVFIESGLSVAKREFRFGIPIYFDRSFHDYFTIALPTLQPRPTHFQSASVGSDQAQQIADMDRIIGAEFKAEYPVILTREIIRATLKAMATHEVAKKDDDGWATALAMMAQIASTSADTRSFSALPEEFNVIRTTRRNRDLYLTLANGVNKVRLDTNASAHVVYVQQVAPGTEPVIDVINIP